MDNVLFYPKNTDENKAIISASINKKIIDKYAPQRQKDSFGYVGLRGGNAPTVFDSWYYKCAEFASAQFLHEKFNFPLVSPDTKIYKNSEKNWNADIEYEDVSFLNKKFDNLRFHVKSANRKTIAKGFPESFMFQYANKDNKSGGKDRIFNRGDMNDYCVFVYCPYDDITSGKVSFYVRTIIPWDFIKENNLLEDPKRKDFIGIKFCVYTESIRRHLEEVDLVEAIK